MYSPEDVPPRKSRNLDSMAFSKDRKIMRALNVFNNKPGIYIIPHIEFEDPISFMHIDRLTAVLQGQDPSPQSLVDARNGYCFAFIVCQRVYGRHFQIGDMSYLYDQENQQQIRETILNDAYNFMTSHPYLTHLIDDELVSDAPPEVDTGLMAITAAFTFQHVEIQDPQAIE